MNHLVYGFADELEKISALRRAGMSGAEADVFRLASDLYNKIGGMRPGAAMAESKINQLRSQDGKSSVMEWLANALRSGELRRKQDAPSSTFWKSPMEEVIAFGEPISEEHAAILGAAPKVSAISSFVNALRGRVSMKDALSLL